MAMEDASSVTLTNRRRWPSRPSTITRIGENEGGSGAFVCDFVVKDLRAVMQALSDFQGMIEDDNDDDDDEDSIK